MILKGRSTRECRFILLIVHSKWNSKKYIVFFTPVIKINFFILMFINLYAKLKKVFLACFFEKS